MKQYCRYCSWLVTDNGIYCEKRECPRSEAQAKRPNNCSDFDLYEGPSELQDAFGDNLNGYRPRRKKKIWPNGQMELFAEQEE